MESAKVIIDLCRAKRGVKPKFTPYHVFMTLKYLVERPHGRLELSKKLGLGEASTRTLLYRLREAGIIRIDSVAGATLTNYGLKIASQLLSRIIFMGNVSPEEYCSNCKAYAIIIRDGSKIMSKLDVLSIRDAIVREGGLGAVIMVFKDGKLLMPLSRNTYEEVRSKEHIRYAKYLKNEDLIIISLCSKSNACMPILVNAVIKLLSIMN